MSKNRKIKLKSEKILVFEPHPDDIAFFISGSIFKWLAEGKEILICTVTTGNNSTFDANINPDEIKAIVMNEHNRALKMLGVDSAHTIQWEYDDLGLDPGRDRLKLLQDMVKLIRTFRPVTVVTMDPKNAENEENADHRLIAMTGLEASAIAAYPNVFREHLKSANLEPHFVTRMLYYLSPVPDIFIDIGGAPLEKKIQLGLEYTSQLDLMLTEAIKRLAPLQITVPMFNLPVTQIWPTICRSMAEDAGAAASKMYPTASQIKYAEAFRLQYLGIVEKLRPLLSNSLAFS